LPETGFVFCSLNNTYKLNPEIFTAWMRILERVPGSVLWTVAGNPSVKANLRREAQIRGVSPDRLVFAGLPVLTCAGDAFAARLGGSLLNAVGLPEMVTGSLADYESLACQLATDAPRLSAIRQRLARNRTTHPLFDTDRYRRNIETAFVTMWERTQRGEPPDSFDVSG
jgi:protein O-GlcNAc transferase